MVSCKLDPTSSRPTSLAILSSRAIFCFSRSTSDLKKKRKIARMEALQPTGLPAGAGGGGLALLIGSLLWPPPPAPPSSAELSDSLEPRLSDLSKDASREAPEECELFSGTLFPDDGCNRMTVSRISAAAIARAEQRAVVCASFLQTDCLFGHEVGLRAPVAFVYDPQRGMRHLLSPKMLTEREPPENATSRRVRLVDPLDGHSVTQYERVNSSVLVEFFERTDFGLSLRTERMSGDSALCVQFLRKTHSDECWSALD